MTGKWVSAANITSRTACSGQVPTVSKTACTNCPNGQHTENNISCVSNTQSCDPSGPSTAGQKTWTSGSWGACRTTGCSGSDILYRGTCYTNSKSCTPSELPANAASGTKAYTSSGRYSSTCVASTCKSSYHKDGSSCVSNTRSCTPSKW